MMKLKVDGVLCLCTKELEAEVLGPGFLLFNCHIDLKICNYNIQVSNFTLLTHEGNQ